MVPFEAGLIAERNASKRACAAPADGAKPSLLSERRVTDRELFDLGLVEAQVARDSEILSEECRHRRPLRKEGPTNTHRSQTHSGCLDAGQIQAAGHTAVRDGESVLEDGASRVEMAERDSSQLHGFTEVRVTARERDNVALTSAAQSGDSAVSHVSAVKVKDGRHKYEVAYSRGRTTMRVSGDGVAPSAGLIASVAH
jgi:hypothetical protein